VHLMATGRTTFPTTQRQRATRRERCSEFPTDSTSARRITPVVLPQLTGDYIDLVRG
jgi:hypothetical protein